MSGYNCPFLQSDCLNVDSLSMKKTVTCNNCIIVLQLKNMVNDMQVSDQCFQTPQIRLYN